MKGSIQKYSFKQGFDHEFEILNLTKVFQEKKDIMVKPHRAKFYQIFWIEKAAANHVVDFESFKIEDNSLVFIASNCVNMFDKQGLYDGKALLFTDEFFCKNDKDLQFLRTSILFSDLYDTAILKVDPNASELKPVFNAMQTEFLRHKDSAQYDILHNMLHVFLLQAERELKKQGAEEIKPCPDLHTVVSFKELLEDNFNKEKSVQKYAADLNITEKQLNKATSGVIGKTPKQIIDERVLLEAKRLLTHSNQSIKEIAYELGHEEPTNFIKYFRKHNEITPLEFRDKYK